MSVTASEHRIDTERGALFATSWAPSGAGRAAASATILLFHDSLGCVELWRDFPEQLAIATGMRVVAYDRLGFGRSDAFPGVLPPTFIHDEAEWAVPRLRDELQLGSLVPFGHSVGGGMAVATAARHRDACVALVTESAQSFNEQRTLEGVRAARVAFAQPGQLERLTRYHGDKARWVLEAWTETWLAPAFANWTLDDELREVRCPTLALHGDADEFGSALHPERIANLVTGPSRAVLLDGCGHVPHREQPERVLDEVTRFLASVLERGGQEVG